MKLCTSWAAALLIVIGGWAAAQAQVTLHWDVNGAAAGGSNGGFGDGNWNAADANWNLDANGGQATQTWVDGSHAVFSAGSDVLDSIVALTGPLNAGSLTVEEGVVHFTGANNSLTLGANPIRVNQGATLSTSGVLLITTANNHVTTLDGGALRNTTIGVGSTFWGFLTGTPLVPQPTFIELTANGGTLDVPNGSSGQYSIHRYPAGVIRPATGVTEATLHKTGPGEIRAANNWTFTALDVQEGLYRIDGNGGGETGFGAPTGTVTVAGGAVENTTNGAALGTSLGLTGANASPATRSFVLSGEGATPDTMIVLNASWTIDGPISGNGGLMLNGWARNDGGGATNIIGAQNVNLQLGGANTYGGATTINFGTLVTTGGSAIPDASRVNLSTRSDWGGNLGGVITTFNTAAMRVDASETVGSLAGGNATRGSVNINGAEVTLTTGADDTSSTFDGAITGTGGLTKSGTGTFTMNGTKSYTGDTTVTGGTLSTNSISLADGADVYLNTGSLFNLNFAGEDTIDSLFINGVGQAIGTWGAIGSGADFTTPLITGTGFLDVTTLPGPVGVPGDYNENGVVDAADYTVWRDNLGGATSLPNDDTAGVGADDYDRWKTNFGNTSGSGSALGAGAVPEPGTMLITLLGLIGVGAACRRR